MSYVRACLNEAQHALTQAENAHADLPVDSTDPLIITATALISIANSLYVLAHTQLAIHEPTTSEVRQ